MIVGLGSKDTRIRNYSKTDFSTLGHTQSLKPQQKILFKTYSNRPVDLAFTIWSPLLEHEQSRNAVKSARLKNGLLIRSLRIRVSTIWWWSA
jgi:hypothetical protein